MLLLLAAVQAFDGYRRRDSTTQARRGWLALSGVLLLLSFDEVASGHEYLLNTGLLFFLPFALLGAALTVYALTRLSVGGVNRRALYCIVLAFVLFATIPVHEYIQQTGTWNDPVVYGLRAAFEEGTELAAIVSLVGVSRRNTRALLDQGVDGLAATAELRAALIVAAAIAALAASLRPESQVLWCAVLLICT